MYQGNTLRNAVVQDEEPGAFSLQATIPLTHYQFLPPLAKDGVFYFFEWTRDASGWLAYAIDLNRGRYLWRYEGEGYLTANPVISGDAVIVPGSSLVFLHTQTGEKIKEFRPPESDYYYAQPLVAGETVYAAARRFGVNIGYLVALDISDGSEIWRQSCSTTNIGPISVYADNIIVTTTNYRGDDTYVNSYRMSDGLSNWPGPYWSDYFPSGPTVIDEENGLGLISNNGVVSRLDLATGQLLSRVLGGADATIPVIRDGQGYFFTTNVYTGFIHQTYFNSFDVATGVRTNQVKISDNFLGEATANPILIGEKIYIATPVGEIWRMNLSGGEIEKFPVSGTAGLSRLTYSDGVIATYSDYPGAAYILSARPIAILPETVITLESPYKEGDEYSEYLGQTHSHYKPDVEGWSKIFNGEPTPVFTEELYKDAGYDFVALTEHDELVPDPGVEGILHITDSEEDTHSPDDNHILAIGVQAPIDESQSEQDRIDDIVVDQDGVAFLSHPNSKMYDWSITDLTERKKYHGIEIFNGVGNFLKNFKPIWGDYLSTDKWDQLLSARKPGAGRWGSAGDDYTPGDGGFDRAGVIVLAKNLNQEEILQNIKDGNFYAVQGSGAPRIKVKTSGLNINVTSNKEGDIKFIGKNGTLLKEEKDVQASTYTVRGDEIYVRVEVEAGGKKAWSQPIAVESKKTIETSLAGEHFLDLGEAQLLSKNTGAVAVSTLPGAEYPDQSPPYGYISPIYSLSTDGQVQEGTELTISYADSILLTNEDNLSIYTYDEDNSVWTRVAGIIDKATKTVKAGLSHFSLYTLSAEMPPDAEPPTVSLAEPADLTDLEGDIAFQVNAFDNNAVFRTMTLIDDRLISSDANPLDGWSAEIDANDYSIGVHKLTLTAEDAAGNIGEANYNFSIRDSAFVPPQIAVDAPQENEFLSGTRVVSGNYSSQAEVDSIGIYLDDFFIADAEFENGAFQREIDWSQFKAGSYALKVVLADKKGNTVTVERTVNTGAKVDIVSPEAKTYYHAESIPIEFNSEPANMIAKIDGVEVANHTQIKAYTLSLGSHTFSVEYGGREIASREFTVDTSIEDQKRLVEVFWQEGRFKNQGTYQSILAKLNTAQMWQDAGNMRMRDLMLDHLISFIKQKSQLKKPHIDQLAADVLTGDFRYLISQK